VVPPAMAAPLTRPRDNKRIEENFIRGNLKGMTARS
jgi:hypothetical protein